MLATAHRSLAETNLEREVLTRLAAIDADAPEAYLRLMELCSAQTNWTAVLDNAGRYVAVNPLLPQPYRYLARACEALDKAEQAIRAYQTLLLLDPPDRAEAHFRLARLLHQSGDPGAKRHVLQALEEAPRFREAHRLLLQMHREGQTPAARPSRSDRPTSPSAFE
jgi:tetratricopeptide (TPR) repeat protein